MKNQHIELEQGVVDVVSLLDCSPDGGELAFVSTRDFQGENLNDWKGALSEGLASDGGLYDPREVPAPFEEAFFSEQLPYLELAEVSSLILRRFIPREDIPDEELLKMLREAHNFGLPLEEITQVFDGVMEGGEKGGKVLLAWLDRGPTASFKDFAARVMGKLLEWWCSENNHPMNIIVATSGDTGVAIARAFEGSKWVSVTVMYPSGGVSDIQEKQMIQADQQNKNVQCFPIEGDFDRAQSMSKILQETRSQTEQIINSVDYRENYTKEVNTRIGENLSSDELITLAQSIGKINLGSANSINAWRYLPQQTQFFVSYGEALKEGYIQPREKVYFSVPTGNVGHLMAGVTAKEMGVPIEGFILATNQNDIMVILINEGILRHKGLEKSVAPSMDILNASNAERLLDYARKKSDPSAQIDFIGIRNVFQDTPEEREALKGGIDIRNFGVTDKMLAYLGDLIPFTAGVTGDEEIAETMKEVYTKTRGRSLPDSHGATGIRVIQKGLEQGAIPKNAKVISLVTANPHKFPQALENAGIEQVPEKYRHEELELATGGIQVDTQKRETLLSIMKIMLLSTQAKLN